ncbi:hypothetical protein FHS59_000355 [Algoriphagus iocasae]|uniref:CD-NTase-associated protein 16 NUDIX domain-containing protein n=1 Tax=Algoriphagus iocasae TaxID=1836499 RepID=A0A841MBQ3_9BACT|nr:hypothetical protein [Algoriphagus iocasae]MBB6324740.1 hypothetical protein [Algoriphagus iocasae]
MGASIAATVGKTIGSKAASVAWENRKFLTLYTKTKLGKYRNKYIRFSLSGLYKIQIPDSNTYLLVMNRRIENQLQPVGGVYKRYASTDAQFQEWGFKPDNSKNGLDVDKYSNGDLRFMVMGKHVIDVLKWFESQKGRETEPRREFKEELIDTNILDQKTFAHCHQQLIRRYSTDLKWSDFFGCYEILIYDIFELLPNEDQKTALIQLAEKGSNLSLGYAIASCDEIEQLRLMVKGRQIARIGQHTHLLINKDLKK